MAFAQLAARKCDHGDARSTTQARASKELQIFTEDSPPSTYLENGKLAGLSAEIVQEILNRLNLADTIKMVPWARGYNLALNEPGVLLFSTTRLPQREELFQWVGPLYTQTWGFYKHKGSPLQYQINAGRQECRPYRHLP